MIEEFCQEISGRFFLKEAKSFFVKDIYTLIENSENLALDKVSLLARSHNLFLMDLKYLQDKKIGALNIDSPEAIESLKKINLEGHQIPVLISTTLNAENLAKKAQLVALAVQYRGPLFVDSNLKTEDSTRALRSEVLQLIPPATENNS